MFCPYCRSELPEDAVFCNHCGRRMPTMPLNVSAATTSTLYQTPIDSALPLPVYAPEPFIPIMQMPPAPVSLNALQRFLVRTFQAPLAGNPVFGVVAGSILSVVAGIAACWLLLSLAHAVVSSTLQYGEESVDYALGIASLHAPFRDVLQLFLVAQGVGLHITYGTGTSATTIISFMPLHGLLIVAILSLTAGGYLSACTDLQNKVRSSLVRGACTALPYTLLLLILSSQVNGNFQTLMGGAGSTSSTLTMDNTTLLFFGLLWGMLFGLLGASLKIAHGQWRQMVRRYLQTSKHPQIVGMVVGGLSASGLGIGLSFLLLSAFLVYTAFSIPWLERNLCLSGGAWPLLTAWGIAQGPLHAVNLFFFLLGTPITIHTTAQACFYATLPQTALTIRNGDLHLFPWVYLFLFIPALSLFLGGRASVAIARVQGIGPSAIQGLLLAVPFTLIMLLLTFMCTVTNVTMFADTVGGAPVSHIQSAGVNMGDLFLWILLNGTLFGALGGMYEGSKAKSLGKQFLSALASMLELAGWPFYRLLDRLYGVPRGTQRSSTRRLLYAFVCSTLLLTIIAALVGVVLITNNQTITLEQNLFFRNIVSILFVTIPGLLLFSALVATLVSNPPAQREPHQ